MYKLPGVSAWSDFFDLEDMALGVPIMHQVKPEQLPRVSRARCARALISLLASPPCFDHRQKDFRDRFGLPNKTGRLEFPKRNFATQTYVAKGWQGIWEISRGYGFGDDELKGDLAVRKDLCQSNKTAVN